MERTLRITLAVNILTLALAAGAFGLAAYGVATGPTIAQDAAASVVAELPSASESVTRADLEAVRASIVAELGGCPPTAGVTITCTPVTLADVATLRSSVDALSARIDSVSSDVGGVSEELQAVKDQVDMIEAEVSMVCDAVPGCR